MNILIVATKDSGGAGIACSRLHQGLLAHGVSSKLLLLHPSKSNIPESYFFTEGWSKPKRLLHKIGQAIINRLPYTKWFLPSDASPLVPIRSVYRLEEHPLYEWADIINLHWVPLFVDQKTFFKINKKPIVWTMHDMLPFSGGYAYEVGFPAKAYKHHVEVRENHKAQWLASQNLTAVGLSKWLKERAQSSKAFSKHRHVLIPNGIDTETYRPYSKEEARSHFNISFDNPVILFVAESLVNPRKGFRFLQEALLKLPNSKPITLLALGGGDVSVSPPHEVHKLGFISNSSDMAKAYSAADIVVIPSIEDNLPNTAVESTCCGTPVVAFNIGGMPDIVDHYTSGYLVDEIDSTSLAEGIQKALNHTFTKDIIRNQALEKFHTQKQTTAYIQLFTEILNHEKTEI